MSTPTPRTSAAIIASGFQAVPEGFRAFAGNLERELTALTTERDQLRAQVERLNALGSWAHTCIHHTDEERKAWVACPCCAIARAARAEDNLAALEQCHDDNCRGVAKIADELAAERARMDWLESSAATELQSERGWIDRAAIDAAMKKDAK